MITKLKNHNLILERLWIKRHDVILNMINDFFTFWSDHCGHFGVYFHKNKNEMNVDFNAQTSVKSQTNFEKISSISSSINIIKRKLLLLLSIDDDRKNEKEMKNSSKVKKKIIRTSKDSRSKDCLASFNITFFDVVVYNLLSKQKNIKLFVVFF